MYITDLNISGRNITSLAGIEHFAALEVLRSNWNHLVAVDVRSNLNLTHLYVSANFCQITGEPTLTSLVVANHPSLTHINAHHHSMNTVNVSNTPLVHLDLGAGVLTSLDVSTNRELALLSFQFNYVNSLDLSNNANLVHLNVFSNRLTELDVSQNPRLEHLSVGRNPLYELDISANTVISHLYADEKVHVVR